MAAVAHYAMNGTEKLAICHAYRRRSGERYGSQTYIQGRALRAPYEVLEFDSLVQYRAWAAREGAKVIAKRAD